MEEYEGGVGPGPEVGLHQLLGQHHPPPGGLQGARGEPEQVSRGRGGRGPWIKEISNGGCEIFFEPGNKGAGLCHSDLYASDLSMYRSYLSWNQSAFKHYQPLSFNCI